VDLFLQDGKHMAAVITVTGIGKIQRDFIVRGTIALSGTYPTGGDTLNFFTANFRLGVDGIKSSFPPSSILCWSQQSQGSGTTSQYWYRGLLGTTAANCAIQVMTGAAAQSGGAEFSAGAYPAGVTGDVIAFEAFFPSY
jgi:hypothetical protein